MMAPQPISAADYAALRARATSHLRAGSHPAAAPRALQVLFDLASDPATAGSALALLQELQVHQVEVELQDEESRRVRTEMESLLARQIQLHDAVPAALLAIDADTTLREANRTAERMFGRPRDLLLGRKLDGFLTPSARGLLAAALAQLEQSDATAAQCELLLASGSSEPVALHAAASADPAGPGFLVVLIERSLSP
jgi:PAS domain-containing protein